MVSTIADRGDKLAANGGELRTYRTLLSDLYHPSDNPDGLINLGISENVSFYLSCVFSLSDLLVKTRY